MKPENTALILIGYQNDYFTSNSILNNTLNALVDSAVTMISTPILFTDDYSELDNPVGILKTIKEVGAFKRSSLGGAIIPDIQAFGERIIEMPSKRGLYADVMDHS